MNFKLKKKIIPCFYGKLKKKFSEQSVSEEGDSGACGDERCLIQDWRETGVCQRWGTVTKVACPEARARPQRLEEKQPHYRV